jgi:hypothetical protein
MATGKIFAIAKNRAQDLWHRPKRGVTVNELLVKAETLERAVQPLRPASITVAVAQKRSVF